MHGCKLWLLKIYYVFLFGFNLYAHCSSVKKYWQWLTSFYECLINKFDLTSTKLCFRAITNCLALRMAWLVFSWLLYRCFLNRMENWACVSHLLFFFSSQSKGKLSCLFSQSAGPLIQNGMSDAWLHIAVQKEIGMSDVKSCPKCNKFLCEEKLP